MRLQKYLASCGLGSRRACEDLISSGRVSVDGSVISTQGVTIDPTTATVCLDNKPVSPERRRYVLLNKPRDVITTLNDPRGRRTVSDLLPDFGVRLYHVGRLDRDSEGALLLTNDGELANALMHPRRQVDKVYHAWTSGALTPGQIEKLKRGIRSEGQLLRAAAIKSLGGRKYSIILRQGKKREIRRMFDRFDLKVLRLKRVAIGPLSLGRLPVGDWRHLSEQEISALKGI